MGGFPKMVGFPNNHWLKPTKNDHFLGCEMGGNPPFKETPNVFRLQDIVNFKQIPSNISIPP